MLASLVDSACLVVIDCSSDPLPTPAILPGWLDDFLLLPSSFIPQFSEVVRFCVLQVLWPYLLECLVPEPFTFAMSSLCRCISHIAAKKREEQAEDFAIDFEEKSKFLFDRNNFRLLSSMSIKKAIVLNKRTLTSFCFYCHDEGQEYPIHHI